jgi:cold shock CspA family protein
MEGVIMRWFNAKGFGFIKPDAGGADVFLHEDAVVGDEMPGQGDRVRFEIEAHAKGPRAVNVELVSAPEEPDGD